jgi:hypothetical protein
VNKIIFLCIAGLMLTTETLVTDYKKDDEKAVYEAVV